MLQLKSKRYFCLAGSSYNVRFFSHNLDGAKPGRKDKERKPNKQWGSMQSQRIAQISVRSYICNSNLISDWLI